MVTVQRRQKKTEIYLKIKNLKIKR